MNRALMLIVTYAYLSILALLAELGLGRLSIEQVDLAFGIGFIFGNSISNALMSTPILVLFWIVTKANPGNK